MRRSVRLIAVTLIVAAAYSAQSAVYIARRDAYVLPADWTRSPSMLAQWSHDAVSGSTVDATGNGNDLTNNNSVGLQLATWPPASATNVKEGTGAADMTSGATRYFSCSGDTCGELDQSGNMDLTWGGWFADNSNASAIETMGKGTDATGALGFNLRRTAAAGKKWECNGGGATSTGATSSSDNGTWQYVICEGTAASGQLNVYVNLTADDASPGKWGALGDSSSDFTIGDPGGSRVIQADDNFVAGCGFSAADRARVCSIGVKGTLGECDAIDSTLYKGCGSNSDCNYPYGICDSGATAKDDTYCTADTTTNRCCSTGGASCYTNSDCVAGTCTANCGGCCMGRNSSTQCGGNAMPACNVTAFCSSPIYPIDWAPYMVANWRFDDASAPATDSATGDGSQNLTAVNSPTFSASVCASNTDCYREGAKAVYYDTATDSFTSSAGALRPVTATISYGCFVRYDDTAALQWTIMWANQNSKGYGLQRVATSKALRCQAQNLTSTGYTSTGYNIPDGAWTHVVCNQEAGVLQGYVNGRATGGSAAVSSLTQPNVAFTLNNSGAQHKGSMDDCWMTTQSLGATSAAKLASICRMCSLGVSGAKGECVSDLVTAQTAGFVSYKKCTTNADCNSGNGVCGLTGEVEGGQPLSRCTGWNATLCNTCTLPACFAAGPGI